MGVSWSLGLGGHVVRWGALEREEEGRYAARIWASGGGKRVSG